MPILHVQLKHTAETDLYSDRNIFNVEQSHRVKSQMMALRRSIVTRAVFWWGGQRNTATNRQTRQSPAPGINEQNHRLTNSILRWQLHN